MAALSFNARRLLAIPVLAQLLFFVLNFYRFHLFGQYDRKLLAVSGLVVAIYLFFIGPSVQEQREYRSKG